MSDRIVLQEFIGEGEEYLKLPSELPLGQKFTITFEFEQKPIQVGQQNDIASDELTEASFIGEALTMGEILTSPEIGIWQDRSDMEDSIEFIEQMRQRAYERRVNGD